MPELLDLKLFPDFQSFVLPMTELGSFGDLLAIKYGSTIPLPPALDSDLANFHESGNADPAAPRHPFFRAGLAAMVCHQFVLF